MADISRRLSQAVILPEEVQRVVMKMESVEIPCPHCGHINKITGFSEVSAFICPYCRRGVAFQLDPACWMSTRMKPAKSPRMAPRATSRSPT